MSHRVNLHSVVAWSFSSLNDCNWIRTPNHLVRKQTVNHLAPVSSKAFFDIQATKECRFALKRVCDMIRTQSQMHHTNKCWQHSSVIWPIWLNGWVFVYELSGCGSGSNCSHLNLRYRTCFEQGVSWHSGNYSVYIYIFNFTSQIERHLVSGFKSLTVLNFFIAKVPNLLALDFQLFFCECFKSVHIFIWYNMLYYSNICWFKLVYLISFVIQERGCHTGKKWKIKIN